LAHVFCSTDAEAIAKIKLLARPSDDFIAWSLEKTGLFSVRSAYNLALKLKTHQSSQSSSSAPDGDRKLWSHIWAGGVPPKVNIFVWKLSRDALPTRRNKFARSMETSAICPLCDRENETDHHATVVCPLAASLRKAMRKHWLLPDEEQFACFGPDWLLLLLNGCSRIQQIRVKLLLWRAWTVHNNTTHQSGPTGVLDSVQMLLVMESSLVEASQIYDKPRLKKDFSELKKRPISKDKNKISVWSPPPPGWTKINVDGSFLPETGDAGVGVIARDRQGRILLSAWRVLQ
jgi:hypothetical protein